MREGGPVDVLVDRPPPRRERVRRPPPIALAIGGGLVAVAALLPAAYLVVRASDAGTARTLEILSDPVTRRLVVRTVGLAAAVTAASVVVAVPLAWLTVRSDLPGRRVWVVLTALPLVIPSYVGGFAFVAALGPRGIVQSWLEPLGVQRLPSVYGFWGAWMVLTLFSYPYVLLTVRAAIRGLDPSLEDAARSLGRSQRSVLRGVTLPLIRPAVVSGSLLVALYTLHDFGAVSLLRYDALTRAIYTSYRASFDRSTAAVLSLVLVALALAVVGAKGVTPRRAYYRAHSGARRPAPVFHLGRWRWPVFAACSTLVVLALVLPCGVVAYWLVRGLAAGEPMRLTFASTANSLQASALGALAALVAAWPVAVLSTRYPGSLSRLGERASYVGYALPGIVVALALVFFGARWAPVLYQTRAMLAFAYVVLFLPLAVGAVQASLQQLNPSLEEAARSLGSGPVSVLRRVVLPLVRPGVLTALALVFLTAMKELPATLLLAPTGFRTLATQVWSATVEAFFARAAAPALVLILVSSVPLAYLVLRESRGRSDVSSPRAPGIESEQARDQGRGSV